MQQSLDPEEWSCRWRVTGVGAPIEMQVYGADAFQALQLVMPMIGITLRSRLKGSGMEPQWRAGDADLGFRSLKETSAALTNWEFQDYLCK